LFELLTHIQPVPPDDWESRLAADREELFRTLYERSFLYRPENPFLLSSGKKSPVYVDCKKTTLGHSRAQYLIGHLIYHLVAALDPEGIGGLTLGADPIGVATSLVSGLYRRPIPAFVVRKETKGHGTKNPIEGDLVPGARIIVVEDVVTTGASGLKAVDICRENGYEVLRVIALVDREEGGRDRFAERGIPFSAFFSLSEFLAYDRNVRAYDFIPTPY
jgi:orotate phosphoribosyltransferase